VHRLFARRRHLNTVGVLSVCFIVCRMRLYIRRMRVQRCVAAGG
jgi:hypothetical protein